VQDVVEGVYLGQSARKPTQKLGGADIAFTANSEEEASSSRRGLDDVVVLVSIDPLVDFSLHVESGAWRRILMNLFANALKYTTRGQVEVSLEMVTDPGEMSNSHAQNIRLVVRDTGKGISKEYLQDRLFTPFAQEDTLTEGTGLGLSIVQQLVASLHGSIDVQSNLGIGTCITVTVPFGPKTQALSPEHRSSLPANRAVLDPTGRLKGCNLHTLECQTLANIFAAPSTKQSELQISGISATRNLFSTIAGKWLGMNVLLEPPPETVDGGNDVPAFVLEHHTHHGDSSRRPEWTLRTRSVAQEQSSDVVVTISQPFGPRKLAMALAHAMSSKRTATSARRATMDGLDFPEESPMMIEDMQPELHSSPASGITTPQQGIPTRGGDPSPMPSNSSSRHLLLVDDNAINLKVLSTCVKRIGHTYNQAMDGKQALEACETSTKPFDLIFMDLSMPVMDGCTATREIRQYEFTTGKERTPIVALTALGAEQAKREALESGVDVFMSKPVKMSEVKALLERMLG
jgi:CheY-like chemotaxis protein/anti-sigma regulatory factor (Ser/Thr protein kinase)